MDFTLIGVSKKNKSNRTEEENIAIRKHEYDLQDKANRSLAQEHKHKIVFNQYYASKLKKYKKEPDVMNKSCQQFNNQVNNSFKNLSKDTGIWYAPDENPVVVVPNPDKSYFKVIEKSRSSYRIPQYQRGKDYSPPTNFETCELKNKGNISLDLNKVKNYYLEPKNDLARQSKSKFGIKNNIQSKKDSYLKKNSQSYGKFQKKNINNEPNVVFSQTSKNQFAFTNENVSTSKNDPKNKTADMFYTKKHKDADNKSNDEQKIYYQDFKLGSNPQSAIKLEDIRPLSNFTSNLQSNVFNNEALEQKLNEQSNGDAPPYSSYFNQENTIFNNERVDYEKIQKMFENNSFNDKSVDDKNIPYNIVKELCEEIKFLKHNIEFQSKKNLSSYEKEKKQWYKNFEHAKYMAYNMTTSMRSQKKKENLISKWEDIEAMIRSLELKGGFDKERDFKMNSIFQFESYNHYINLVLKMLLYFESQREIYENIKTSNNFSIKTSTLISDDRSKFQNTTKNFNKNIDTTDRLNMTYTQLNKSKSNFNVNPQVNSVASNKINFKEEYNDTDIFNNIDYHKDNIKCSSITMLKAVNSKKGDYSLDRLNEELESDNNILKNFNTPDQTYNQLLLDVERSKNEIAALSKELNTRVSHKDELADLKNLFEKEKIQAKDTIEKMEEKLSKKKLFFQKANLFMVEAQKRIEELENKNDKLEKEIDKLEKKLNLQNELNKTVYEKIEKYREISLMGLEDYNVCFNKNLQYKRYINNFRKKFIMSFDFEEKDRKLEESFSKNTIFSKQTVFEQNTLVTIAEFTKQFVEGHYYIKFNSISDKTGAGVKSMSDMQIFFKTYFRHVADRVETGDRRKSIRFSEICENLTIDKVAFEIEDIELYNKLKIFKPSYYFLIKNQINTVMNKTSIEKLMEDEFSLYNVLETVRAIFDSKYMEFQMSPNMKTHSRFPEFVYVWLENYSVNEITHQVGIASFDKNTPDGLRMKFLLQLTSNYYYKIWECYTFKEFLEGKYSNDDLFYYLTVRNYILKGRLVEETQAMRDHCIVIDLEKVNNVIDQFIGDLKVEVRASFLNRLRKYSKESNGNREYVDVNLLLRILLEYYRAKKIVKFSKIKAAYASYLELNKDPKQKAEEKKAESNRKVNDLRQTLSYENESNLSVNKSRTPRKSSFMRKSDLSHLSSQTEAEQTVFEESFSKTQDFQTFSALIKEFYTDSTLTELVEQYSNAYNYGCGKITLESFFIAAQESCFFIKDMELEAFSNLSFELPPTKVSYLDNVNETREQVQYWSEEMQEVIIKKIDSMESFITTLKKEINTFGSEKLKHEFDRYLSCFKNDYIKRGNLVRGEGILAYYLRFKEFLMNITHRIIIRESFRYMSLQDELKMITNISLEDQFKPYISIINTLRERKELKVEIMNDASRTIQKWLRTKIRKWYQIVRKLLMLSKNPNLDL